MDRDTLIRKATQLLTDTGGDSIRTVAELLDAWRADGWPAWKAHTRRAYSRHIELIGRFLGDVALEELDGTHAEYLRERVAIECGAAQSGLVCNTLKTVSRFGVGAGWMRSDPLRRVRRVQSRRRDRSFSREQVRALDGALARMENPHWPSPAAACRVILWTGERESAIRGLRWCDVHVGFASMELPSSKRAAPRARPLPEQALRVLAGMAANRRSRQAQGDTGDLVFPGRRGDVAPVSSPTVRRLWREALESIGVEPCGLHVARHTAASLAAEAGATNRELMELYGWESPQIPARYTRVTPARLRALVQLASGEDD